jgi:hypothetical protein
VGASPADLDVALEPSGTAVPASPSPADGSKNVGFTIALEWADTGAQSYDVYFGPTADPPKVATVTQPAYSPQALEPARTYYWKVATASSCGSAAGPLWSFTTMPYQVAGVVKRGNPFRLNVTGSGFTDACAVKIDGRAAPRTAYRDGGSLTAKGGADLKAQVPKGTSVQVTVEDPAGGMSNAFPFSW